MSSFSSVLGFFLLDEPRTAPMFWAPLADLRGRRPIYLGLSLIIVQSSHVNAPFWFLHSACLGLLTITCVALALVPLDKWYLLLVFRCFQATGSASTVALGSGVVADIATPAERGGFLGLALLGPLVRLYRIIEARRTNHSMFIKIGPCVGE